MAYFIFSKDSDNVYGTIYRMVENQSDLEKLNINQSNYKIIEDSQSNFDDVKYGIKHPIKYNQNTIIYENNSISFQKKEQLSQLIDNLKLAIKQFLDNNKNHVSFNIWNNYYNQLLGLNLDNITYPLNKSLEQHFKDQNQLSLNTLQLP